MPASEQLPSHILIVDTNTIAHGAWRLDSPAWRVVLHQARSGHARVIVPELVIREAVGRYRSELELRLDGVTSVAKKLGELVGDMIVSMSDVSVDELVATYESVIRTQITDSHAEIVTFPEFEVDSMVQRAIERRRPFDEKGSGFRDAILWETVVSIMQASPDSSTILISNDRKAFADLGGDHELNVGLAEELVKRGVAGVLRLCLSLTSYLDVFGIGDPKRLDALFEAFQIQQDDLADQAKAALQGQELIARSPAVRVAIESVISAKVALGRASQSTEDEGLSLVHVVVETHAQLEVRMDNQESVSTISTVLPLTATGTATYDSSERHIANLNLEVPSLDDTPEVLELLRSFDQPPSSASFLSPLTTEAARQALFFKVTPEMQEAVRKAISFNITPEMLENITPDMQEAALRIASSIQIAPEAARQAVSFKMTPEMQEALRKATSFKFPPKAG